MKDGGCSLSLFKTQVAGATQYSSIRDDASARERVRWRASKRSSLSSPCFSNPMNQFFLSTRQFASEIKLLRVNPEHQQRLFASVSVLIFVSFYARGVN